MTRDLFLSGQCQSAIDFMAELVGASSLTETYILVSGNISITLYFERVILDYISISPRWGTKHTLRICVSVPSRLGATPSFCVQRSVASW